jgi:hypothetical protein
MKTSKILYLLILLLGSTNLFGVRTGARNKSNDNEWGTCETFRGGDAAIEISNINQHIRNFKDNKDFEIQQIMRPYPGMTEEDANYIYDKELNNLNELLKALYKTERSSYY